MGPGVFDGSCASTVVVAGRTWRTCDVDGVEDTSTLADARACAGECGTWTDDQSGVESDAWELGAGLSVGGATAT